MVGRDLPAKRSRDIQRRHVRRVMTSKGPKDVLVNPGVRKDGKKGAASPGVPRLSPRGVGGVPASPNVRSGLIRFPPREAVFRSAEEFWLALQVDESWFMDVFGDVNNNIDLARDSLYSMFLEYKARGNSDVEALSMVKRDLDYGFDEFVDNYFGGDRAVALHVTSFGEWDLRFEESLPEWKGDRGDYRIFFSNDETFIRHLGDGETITISTGVVLDRRREYFVNDLGELYSYSKEDYRLADSFGEYRDGVGYTVFNDPFDGEVFLPNKGEEYDFDRSRWFGLDTRVTDSTPWEVMSGSVTRGNYTVDDSSNYSYARKMLNVLDENNVPFLHSALFMHYPGEDTDFVLIPREYERLVVRLLKKHGLEADRL